MAVNFMDRHWVVKVSSVGTGQLPGMSYNGPLYCYLRHRAPALFLLGKAISREPQLISLPRDDSHWTEERSILSSIGDAFLSPWHRAHSLLPRRIGECQAFPDSGGRGPLVAYSVQIKDKTGQHSFKKWGNRFEATPNDGRRYVNPRFCRWPRQDACRSHVA
jgi:hypothetical protein